MAFLKKLKDRKKTRQNGKFELVEVGGEEVPQLHFSEVEMDLYFATKKIHLKASFRDAFPKGKLRVYKFEVEDVKVFYI